MYGIAKHVTDDFVIFGQVIQKSPKYICLFVLNIGPNESQFFR